MSDNYAKLVQNNLKNLYKKRTNQELADCLPGIQDKNYVVFDYMGVWDFVVLVYVADVSRIYEYKKKFLLKNRYNLIIQSSSMILAPATELPFYID